LLKLLSLDELMGNNEIIKIKKIIAKIIPVANTDKSKNILIYLIIVNNVGLFIILLFISQAKQRLLKIIQKI